MVARSAGFELSLISLTDPISPSLDYHGSTASDRIPPFSLSPETPKARTTLFPNQPVWWKRHLTTLQITQFVIDLAICYLNTYTHFTHDYYPWLPHYGSCAGGL